MTVRTTGKGGIIDSFGKLGISARLILIIYIASFSGATFNHIRDIADTDFLYSGIADEFPLWVRIYWSSLTVLDPAAVVLLLFSIRKGIALFFLVIVSDVLINISVLIFFRGIASVINIYTLAQIAFLVFLIVTGRIILKEIE